MTTTQSASRDTASFPAEGIIIQLNNSGKRFNRDWIFRNLSFSFAAGKAYAITGPNGSGKSTLLQSIGGSIQLSEGTMGYQLRNAQNSITLINPENAYQYISLAAPYVELIEEMTAKEFLHFHSHFKTLLQGISVDEILTIIGLEKAANKQIRYYSSGMKQRLKLAQAIFSDVPVLLLDEPCTNLDNSGYALYHQLIDTYCKEKLIIVSSNDEKEMNFCSERLLISDYK